MSRRWEKRQSFVPLDAEALYRERFGVQATRDPADVTVLPDLPADVWREGLRAAALAVGSAALVIASWAGLRALLGIG